jgi:hypothetical protein
VEATMMPKLLNSACLQNQHQWTPAKPASCMKCSFCLNHSYNGCGMLHWKDRISRLFGALSTIKVPQVLSQ